eukprot:scaffold422472_cov36-Prasinocladus_malaysianus.AAC.1
MAMFTLLIGGGSWPAMNTISNMASTVHIDIIGKAYCNLQVSPESRPCTYRIQSAQRGLGVESLLAMLP